MEKGARVNIFLWTYISNCHPEEIRWLTHYLGKRTEMQGGALYTVQALAFVCVCVFFFWFVTVCVGVCVCVCVCVGLCVCVIVHICKNETRSGQIACLGARDQLILRRV